MAQKNIKVEASPASRSVKTEPEEATACQEPHEHQFRVKFSSDEIYTIDCVQPCTVLEAIKPLKKFKKMVKGADGNVIIQMGTGDDESIVPTHFPCSCVGDHEVLTISCKAEKVESAQVQDSKIVHPRDAYSVFYIDTKGGLNAKKKKLFKSGTLKQFRYLCVYGEKGITVAEALKRDGRFTDDLGYFELVNINDKCKTECTDRIDNLENKKFQICLPRGANTEAKELNQQADHVQLKQQKRKQATNNAQRKTEIRLILNVAQRTGISLKRAAEETDSSIDPKEVYELLCKQYPRLKQWMKSRFHENSFQETLKILRKDNFGKIQQSFSEIHKVRLLLELSESVCFITGSFIKQGTGFVLFDNYVLTNAHLFKYYIDSKLPNWHEIANVTVVFNFETQEFKEMNKINAKVFVGDAELDYIILKLEKTEAPLETESQVPPGLLKRFGPVPLDGEACVVGHPGEGVKKMDPTCVIEKDKREEAVNKNLEDYKEYFITLYAINQAIKNDPYENIYVTYNTFMYHGSSGSPVFDATGQVFGLHSGGFFWADLQNRLEGQELAVNAMDERMGVLEAKCRPCSSISMAYAAAGEKPRTIIAGIHHFQTKELILRLARMKKMEYKGNKVLIFPDYTSEVMSQRHSFRNVMQVLREDGIKFQLRYPAKLRVYWKESDMNKINAKVFMVRDDLDYAILKLETENQVPPGLLKRFGPVPLDGAACVVGHPGGGVKKMDPTCVIEKDRREEAVSKNLEDIKEYFITIYAINQAIKNDPYKDIRVTYNSFMYHGSSGSPVFDAYGQVFGLHTGGFFYDDPKPNHSVIEFSFPLLTIFKNFLDIIKGDEDMVGRVEEAAKGNPHLENIIASVLGSKQDRPEELLQGVQGNTEDSEEDMEISHAPESPGTAQRENNHSN
ncbi:serine protease FAM111A-like [Oreochromis aureus]|uniref:serine protease FAM111A-like n=1 Tax=Oreochromis aureus TaxID=47969 RepID=UPI00195467A2|nr:serine protease FAM111A-like [Oreochromis aureus]